MISLLFDPLSLFFIFVISLISIPSAIYSIGYFKKDYPKTKIILAWVLFALFLISMFLVVTVSNVFTFLIVWEIMSLVSYFLVVFDSTHEKSIQAGLIYVVMTHIGTAFLIAAFMIMANFAGSFEFAALKSASQAMPYQLRNLVFVFLLIGFGTKAGLVPLHIWLPYAHPQAPSPISSLMSAVMIKTAIYGILRFIVLILGVSVLWWGVLILVLAGVSCLVGIIYALVERDLKKLLAYSSVENIGIIFLGLGLSVFFFKLGMFYLAVFALAASLYHLLNHAIFKGLLFLCAGSVYQATGTRDIEKMGGLIKVMPWTSACFLVGAMAISAIPPFNGFVSEWLTLQAFFLGAFSVSGGWKLFLGMGAVVLALTGGLAAACFVKAFGITFLALPRTDFARNAKEVSGSMKFGMTVLAVLALIFGLAAGIIIKLLTQVSGFAFGIDIGNMKFGINNFVLSPECGNQIYLSAPILAGLILFSVILAIIIYFAGKQMKPLAYNTWDCGYYKLDARNEYTAVGFSKPFRIAFGFFLMSYKKIQKTRDSFYHIQSFTYETNTKSIFKEYIYKPLVNFVLRAARFMRRAQAGSVHIYIGYIFAAIILLLVFMNRF